MDVFVFVISFMSFIPLRLLLIVLVSDSRIEREMQIAVRSIRMRDRAVIPEVMTILKIAESAPAEPG
jgi:hypothetical protein